MTTAAAGQNDRPARPAGAAVIAAIVGSLALGGCAGQASDLLPQILAKTPPPASGSAAGTEAPQALSEIEKATEYWGKKFAQSPENLNVALNYARNLKAMGQKRQALPVLQQASVYHGQSRELASEYGRLALELDQLSTAKPLLAMADDPTKPDWRVVSARGTLLAKEGNYKDAIPFFERAMALSNSSPTVMNNLAMAYALNGEAERSEQLLRQAASRGGPSKVRQNLALVLGLQGKYDEAATVGARDQSATVASADTALVRQMVKLEPKTAPATGAAVAPAATAGAAAGANPAITPAQVAAKPAPAQVAAPPQGVAKAAPAAPASFRPTAPPDTVASGSWQAQVATSDAAQPPSKAPVGR